MLKLTNVKNLQWYTEVFHWKIIVHFCFLQNFRGNYTAINKRSTIRKEYMFCSNVILMVI